MTTRNLLFGLLILSFFLVNFKSSDAAIFKTTSAGGLWNSTTTWQGGVPPGSSTDTVIVRGILAVNLNVSIGYLQVDTVGTVLNASTSNYDLGVDIGIKNYGIIKNNTVYNLTITLGGFLYQFGVMSNNTIRLRNTTIDLDAEEPISCSNITNPYGPSFVNVLSDTLQFNNTNLNINGCTINFNNGVLILNGGSLIYPDIYADNLDLTLTSGAYLQGFECFANHVWLKGTVDIVSGTFYQNTTNLIVEVEGILQNRSTYSYTMNVEGDLINNGTIQDNYYTLTLNISGDIENNGTWANETTNLDGNEIQHLSFNMPFSGATLINTNYNNYLVAETDLEFNNTHVDFNNDTLYFNFNSGKLILNGGYFREFKLMEASSPYDISIELNSNAYIYGAMITFSEIHLLGTYQFQSTMIFNGNVTVQGTLQNDDNYTYTATINGNITNNGSINDNYYTLTLNITGDIVNNGTWTNANTNLTGTDDQSLFFNQAFNGTNLTNIEAEGKVLAETDLVFNDTKVDMNSDTLEFVGSADSLVVNSNNLREARITREAAKVSGNLKVNLINGAWLTNIQFFADQVELYGVFQFETPLVFNSNVINNGTFQNYTSYNQTADIYGNLNNLGTITDNYYTLMMNISGDIQQNGSWSNNQTNLTGTTIQTLNFSQPFTGEQLFSNNVPGKIITQSNLIFINTLFDLNADTLEFVGSADSLVIIGNTFREAKINREAAKTSGSLKINLLNSAWFNTVDIFADQVELYGIFQFESNMNFYGNVKNHGILQNYSSYNQAASVFGNITNLGSIIDNYYTLSLYIEGDIEQHGTWACENTYLINSASRNIDQIYPFSGEIFTSNVSNSIITVTSDLIFENTNIDLNNATVNMPVNAVLSIQDGNFQEADFPTDGIEVHMNGGGYLQNVSFVSPRIMGITQIHSGVTFSGHTIVEGTLQNHGSYFYTLNVNGSIENHGIIQDNFYDLRMYVQEDILNNGTWTNGWTQLEGYSGSVNQTVELQDGHYIDGQLRLFANNSSNFAWYKNGNPLIANPDYSGATSQVLNFLVPADNIRAGVYNCNTLAGWSRNINIVTTSSDYPVVSLTVLLEGPFNGTDMDTDLNDFGSLPLSQPYDVFPNNYFGTQNVVSIPNPDIVDWVLVEFRDAVDGNNAGQSTRVNRQPAFLLSDGSVVDLDGTSNLSVPHNFANNMFVLIHHRNHLGVMSAVALNDIGGTYAYDFSYDSWNSYGGPNASKNIGTELDPIYGIMGGDADRNGVIDAGDYAIWKLNAGSSNGYLDSDFDLDSEINNIDKNDLWYTNQGKSTQYPD